MADKSTYLPANRSITFTKEGSLTLKAWLVLLEWANILSQIQLHYSGSYQPFSDSDAIFLSEFHWFSTEVMKKLLKYMISDSFKFSIKQKVLNIHWFQFLVCKYLVVLSVIYHLGPCPAAL